MKKAHSYAMEAKVKAISYFDGQTVMHGGAAGNYVHGSKEAAD